MSDLSNDEIGLGSDSDSNDGFDEDITPLTIYDELEPKLGSELEKMTLGERCRYVIEALVDNRKCWNSGAGTPEAKVFSESDKALLDGENQGMQFPTALHLLAYGQDSAILKAQATIIDPIILYLLECRKKKCRKWAEENRVEADSQEALLQAVKHPNGQPILALAAESKNRPFINFVAQNWPEGFPAFLDACDASGKNCIHLMLNAERELYVDFVRKAWPSTLAAKDGNGNTALHYILDHRLLKAIRENPDKLKRKQVVQVFDLLLERADPEMRKSGELNKNGLSPYQYHLDTLPSKSTAQRHNTRDGKALAAPQTGGILLGDDKGKPTKEGDQAPGPTGPMLPLQVKQMKAPTGPRSTTTTQALILGPCGDNLGITMQSTGIAINTANTGRVNAAGAKQAKAELHSKGIGKGKPNLPGKLKLHYLRNRTELEARKLICTKDKLDINLSLDAMRHHGESADKIVHLVDSLAKAGGFDSILSLVRLPVISHTPPQQAEKRLKTYAANQAKARSGSNLPNPASTLSTGRCGLAAVFDRLYQAGVRRIVRLEVYDTETPYHTDDAIEDAFRSRQGNKLIIERWNWRKPDLNTDVILESAGPEIQQLHLHWSGNTTILKAWAAPGGIPSLVSQSHGLSSIIIHYSLGYESASRVQKAIHQFNQQVTGDFELKFDDNPASSIAELDVHSEWLPTGIEAPDEHLWVRRMEEFRSALISLHRLDGKLEPRRVKVAIIDDGVDYDKIKYYDLDGTGNINGKGSKVTGSNYCTSGSNWYHSSGNHGTLMTNSVLRINPWADIWMFKVQSARSPRGGRNIYPSSAAAAIRDCIGHGFDIISMSWVVKYMAKERTNSRSGENVGGEKISGEERASIELFDAILKAKDDNILMFCAASNEIDALSKDMLPFVAAPGHIFRIGAADALGQPDAATSSPREINYYFPGNHVADAWDQRSSGQIEYHDGSSVATALAVGLASVILYCAAILETQCESGLAEYSRFKGMREQLRNRNQMKKALDNIDKDNDWHELKFLPVWDQFGNTAEKMKGGDKEKSMQELARLMSVLYPC
ncbi:hypothetical protein F5Y10DRAFT_172740 [Nemania abortiva]|nr:hypothetical protein F5Y10DRAFT_172740 [Nemania abortiva]